MDKNKLKQQEIAEKLANLPDNKQKIFIDLLQKEGIDPLSLPIISSSRESNSFPISWGQERLWFIEQLEGESASYNLQAAVRITGELKVEALDRVLQEIVRRHEILRTDFREVDGKPVQDVKPEGIWPLLVEDWQGRNQTDIEEYARKEAILAFELSEGPKVRSRLLQMSENEYILLLTRHHIIWDGWSTGIFLQELSALYEAYVKGEKSSLAPLEIQYADYAVWQRRWLSREMLKNQLDYWKKQLDGAPSLLQLPTDRPRPPAMTYRGKSQRFAINKNLVRELQGLSREHDTTLFMTLFAAWATLLYRYSNQDEVSIGTPIANRNRREVEPLIGFFVNTLVLKTKFKDNPSFRDILKQVREVTLSAYAHQDVPFEQVVDALQPERSLSHSPLFQVMFVLQNTPKVVLELSEVTIAPLHIEKVTTDFDLTLDIEPTGEELVGSWEYNTDLFDDRTITRMAGHFQNLLKAIASNPEQKINELPVLKEWERHQLLVKWNDTATEYPSNKCIHSLFEQQVERTPEKVAVVFEESQLTYCQLNESANQLAHYLRSLGVGPEVLVGLWVERSIEMVVGLLGILKAGGAYVPLDPNYPAERLAYMLSNSSAKVLLTQSSLVEGLPEHQARVVCLDMDWGAISTENQENLLSGVKQENLACVIYTSGSTGNPKGVMIPHRAISNHILWMQQTFPLTEADKILQKTPFSFDVSIWEFYAPLLVGATLVVARPGGHQDGNYLIETIRSKKITTIQVVPSILRMLSETDGFEHCKYLKNVFCGGEVLSVELKEGFSSKLDAKLHNLYGPTEACIDSNFYSCQKKIAGQIVPIGHPIANTQTYVLDNNLQPVPIGVPGELHIGGTGLARGYFNRSDLTSDKFIPNPFSNSPGTRLYKTGDLARYLPDGNIEYIGRIDNQVKLRGFRIELGEIESVLDTHLKVKQAAVVAREDIPGDKRLVAYIVSNAEPPTVRELREFLTEKLPEYMVPAAFVMLEAMPLTPNGKLSRRDLPAPDSSSFASTTTFVAPVTPAAELLANIWSEVLGLEKLSIHDNFFELGGHSLLATRVISRIREVFKVELPVRNVFEFPTIASLSQAIEKLGDSGLLAPAIVRVSREAALPLSFAQERLWFLNQLEGPSATYNMPAAIKLLGNLNVTALEQALVEIVRRHEVLRTSFGSEKGVPYQKISSTANITLNVVDLQQLLPAQQSAQVNLLAKEFSFEPFDLSSSPLVRVSLLHLEENSYVLLLNMHHIISDGWSIGVLIQELSSIYGAYYQGKELQTPALPIQYGDYAHWQRQWLTGEVLASQISYWKEHLAGIPPLLELPTDRPRPPVQTFRGRIEHFVLSAQLTSSLKSLSKKAGATLYMTLLAAFSVLLYRYSGQSDVVIGSPIAGRNRWQIEELIGLFVNTLVLRTRLESHQSFSELLCQVRQVTLDAYGHQDLPFEQLVEELQPQRNLAHSPIFQVMFVMQNVPMAELQLPGITLTQQQTETVIAKFDLTLSIVEKDSQLNATWEYNTDLFDGSTVKRMAGHYQRLLEAIVASPEVPVSQLPMLSAAQREQLLVEWNQTGKEYPQTMCIHSLFEQQVERTPNAVAVVFEESQLTYRQLNQRANQLAHYLRSLGVRPEVLVGICVERSLEMVVGLLGILKVGGAYIPLDPAYPTERIARMLSDAQVSVILTSEQLLSELPKHQAQVLCLDKDWSVIAVEKQENPLVKIKPENLAYTIYTSGSTGKPKGAMNTHAAISNRLLWIQDAYKLTPDDRVLQKTPFSFDVSVWEFFWPLLAGATIVVAKPNGHKDSAYLAKLIADEGVTILHFVPSMLQVFLLELDLSSCDCLRRVICSGEALPAELVSRFFERLTCSLHNLYGPTEAAIDVTYYQCHPHKEQTTIPIGRPIANTQMYILDELWQPVPIGVAGELHIGGTGLARGYLNRPDLTSSKFIPNPFSNSPGARLYKTGDLARYLPDGNIEYIGRIDNQVKIRGFRIELGEIEATLVQHPGVLEAAVMAREDMPGDKRLVAYLVGNAEPPTVREFLTEKLPEYMVPAAFVILEAMPLTPNGKLDRRALPLPEKTREKLEIGYQAPRIPEETFLCEIYSQLLDVSPVGVHDNFFNLGGHSLMAVRLMALIQSKFNAHLPLAILFKYPTVAEFARLLSQEAGSISWPTLVPVQVKGNQRPLFFVPGAGGNVIYANNLAHCLGTERPFYGLQPKGLDGQTSVDDSVLSMAKNYIKAIKEVQTVGPYYIAGHSFGGWIAYEMGRQLQRAGEKVGLVLAVDTVAPKERKSKKEKLTEEWQWLEMLLGNAEGVYGKEIGVKGEELQKLKTVEEQYEYALGKLIESGIFPGGAQVRQLKGIMNVYKMNNDIEYIVEEEIEKIPLVLLRAQESNTEDREIVKEEWYQREDWGWSGYSSIPLKVEWIPGDHHTMMAPPQVETLAEKMLQYIQEAEIEE